MKRLLNIVFLLLMTFSAAVTAKDKAFLIKVDGGIGPATRAYIQRGINTAEKENGSALVIMLNTPGGLLESTRGIVSDIMDADVPVIVYVAPSGSRAGSAGVFITLSANIAAMAPGTNIGAAHPVGMGGEADTSVMFEKVTNDAAAFVRTIAEKRHRNVDWAEKAVRESISSTDNEALEAGAIDLISPNVEALLDSVNGRTVELKSGDVVLQTLNVPVEEIERNWKEELLALLSDPNIAYILLMIGFYGIIFELYSPGSIFPGVIGAICLIIGAYSMQMLPINWAGLALIILAIILFLVEIKVQSYGLLTIGGIVSLLLGSIMLIDEPYDFMEISMSVIITMVVLTTLFFMLLIYLGLKAQFIKKVGGSEGMIGEKGRALTEVSKDGGSVKVHGENWRAVSDMQIAKDDRVEVISVKGLTVKVKKIQ